MTTAVFYERAVALDRATHQGLKVRIQPDHYAFARNTNALPIAASEFADVGRHYPIVFVGDEQNAFHAVALLGLQDRSNLFVTEAGAWQAGCYIPAFARRYPFVLGSTADAQRLAVCVDEAYPGINTEEGAALFQDGKESEYLTGMLDFLRAYQREIDATNALLVRLKELGLLVQKSITLTRDGQDQFLRGFWVVDDERLADIDDAYVVELFHSGLLRLIELHRASLGNVQRLAARLDEQRAA